jgi:hypothetical protein
MKVNKQWYEQIIVQQIISVFCTNAHYPVQLEDYKSSDF